MVPVELSSIQAEYYCAMLTKNYQILRNIGKGVAQQSMLNIVMQLRKVCNHPYLIPGTEPDSGSVEFLHEMRIKASAKLTLLHSMLKILHKEGHGVLIFSQMTKLLDILEDYLSIEFGPKTYERVDGSVSVADRQSEIARFNQDKSRFVFLLSTHSCRLGINLATDDTVIIYDSDFIPHDDIQAMNRAHRIGQSNRLLVYRLVVRASVEERILQLAKKKLMLDQLFVNKSGSQKEVEDILKWGTEELFNDSPCLNGKDTNENNSKKDEMGIDIEHKHRKRIGGLGDVYKDRCTDSSSKIVWEESAILKLLDRSNLQNDSTDVAEGDSENDMLGSVKSLEWNDDPTEEHGIGESPSHGTDDMCMQNPEGKEDNVVAGTEENEWDRLLRVRWEKYQSEEEAALGRGKRQRKAVSYREAYAPHPSETMSESDGEEEREPEPEPKREYTPAGRALKAKLPTTFSSFPENHRKVLENIMMRTGSASNNFKKESKSDGWSEDELDSLWIGVRRHGRGNWDAMLRNPRLKFSKYKISKDLSVRWEDEQLKIFRGPPFPLPKSTKMTKSTKSTLFPISDGMMERALHGSKFTLPPKFQTHLTDMKLGIGDPAFSMPHFKTLDRPSLPNDHFMSVPSLGYDKHTTNFPEDAFIEPSDRQGTSSSVHTERPFLLNSLGTSCLGSLGLDCSGSIDKKQKDDEQGTSNCGKLPRLPDGSPNDIRENHINLGNEESTSPGLPSDPLNRPDHLPSNGEAVGGSSTSKDKLPHWLREAVSAPAKLPYPELPPTVSAIARSIRMLYGEDKSTIPPFVIPGPPPSLPKDPRISLKKREKRRAHKFSQILPDVAGSSYHVENDASSTTPLGSPFPLLSHTGTPGLEQIESDLNLPPTQCSKPFAFNSAPTEKDECRIVSFPFLEGKLPLPRPVPVNRAKFKFKDSEGAFETRRPRQSSSKVRGPLEEHQVKRSHSGDSSKTQSDASRVERPDEEEISSEGTVSDHAVRDQET
ncbi:hypothetical protein L6164_031725 [Bauhinia variegata]|uniref:Uncharacterized protein n=1 Tax=Bauhinia variegata TaxID=167791 RepID=A0ACB9KLK8_BAUVA|nr:hypothetical protein L6164_031725 [Bauhinia variegata]